jgi:hypothetical protein
MTSRSAAFRTLAACGIAIALGGAQAARAIATSTQVASSTYTGGGILYLFASASCPPGEIAVGGGVGVSNPYFLVARSSGPTYDGDTFYNGPDGLRGAPNGWRGQATLPTAAIVTVKAGAVCAPAADVQTSVASATIPVGETRTVIADCPAGTVALSGGVQAGSTSVTVLDFQPTYASGSLATFPLGAAPAPDGWTATVRNDDIFERLMKVAAICLAETDALVTTQVTNFAVVGNDVGGGGLACPDGTTATGGALVPPDGGSFSLISNAPRIGSNDLATVPDGANPPPDAWHANSRNLGSSLVFAPLGAICAPEPDSALLAGAAIATMLSLRRPGTAARLSR